MRLGKNSVLDPEGSFVLQKLSYKPTFKSVAFASLAVPYQIAVRGWRFPDIRFRESEEIPNLQIWECQVIFLLLCFLGIVSRRF